MTAIDDARAHLVKAREFLDAAVTNNEMRLFNAATSNAVTAGINAKDAICLKLTGLTNKSDRHADAGTELSRSGPSGRAMASTLGRLLKLKTKSQNQTTSMAASDALRSIEWANRLVEVAQEVVSS